jgi:hypothetical protein
MVFEFALEIPARRYSAIKRSRQQGSVTSFYAIYVRDILGSQLSISYTNIHHFWATIIPRKKMYTITQCENRLFKVENLPLIIHTTIVSTYIFVKRFGRSNTPKMADKPNVIKG